jgi:hypothetical protein
MKRFCLLAFCSALILTATGCFGVSSETRALRDAALDNTSKAEEKFELGLGFLTFGTAKVALKYIDLPVEARTALASVHGAEVSIYDLPHRCEKLGDVMAAADRAMRSRGCERLAGVIHEGQLVAVYIPHEMNSTRSVKISVLVLNERQLVCASARGNVQDLLEIGFEKAREKFPAQFQASAR